MDYQKFITQLPQLYHQWGTSQLAPKSPQFQKTLDQIQVTTTANIMQLLNFAVACLEDDEVFCQIGLQQGGNLIGALLNNPEKMAYVVDNLEDHDLEILTNNLALFNLEDQIIVCDQMVTDFFYELREIEPSPKIGVYFYNSLSDYRSQLLGLLIAKDFLADQALIIVNNNLSGVQQAIYDFMLLCPQCQMLLDLFTLKDREKNFGNGIQILSWNCHNLVNYDLIDFQENLLNQPFIDCLTNFSTEFESSQKVSTVHHLKQQATNLHQQGDLKAASQYYQQVIQWDKNDAETWHNWGMLDYQQQDLQSAINKLSQALVLDDSKALYHYNFGFVVAKCGYFKQAITAYYKALELESEMLVAYDQLNDALMKIGDHEGAIKIAEQASNLYPKYFSFSIKKYLTVPVIYQNESEIKQYYQRFETGLDNLIENLNLKDDEFKQNALESLKNSSNFFIAYQGLNHLDLQNKYGYFVTKIMETNFPQWSLPRHISPLENNRKIKVGYISGCMRNNTVGKLTIGWLKNHNHQNFEIHCYYISHVFDDFTQQFKNHSDYFYHINNDFEQLAQQIIDDNLDILVFLDIGMQPEITMFATLRLAPIQCTTWGHPVTSGLATIDYFLSSDLMEREDGKSHYSEQLIRLPNIGISYPKPKIPQLTNTRKDFKLLDSDLVYLCCQTLIKYLPQHDYLLAAIAQKVPQSKFVFIARPNQEIASIFLTRLKPVFANFGLNSDDYCLMLPQINGEQYLQLNLLSDIFLDSLGWSGGHTTLEALACNLPVVTCPGELMRSRHSYGILKMLGVEETIAYSEQEYIDIAVKLALDSNWRTEIKNQIQANHDRLYDDLECVKALEDFYQRVFDEQIKTSTEK